MKKIKIVTWLLIAPLILSGCGKIVGGVSGEDKIVTELKPCSIDSVTTEPCKVENAGVAVSDNFGADLTTWANPTAGTKVTADIPNGFYVNADVEFTEPQLQPANIVAGATIFGVTGTAAGMPTACSVNGLQGANCAASSGTYWTNLLGINANGADGSLVIAIPQGYHSGTTATASDSDLIASNIRSGTNVFGVAGNLTPAYAACTDDQINAGQCSTATNRYVTATAGANINGANGQLSFTIPLGFQDGTKTATASDTNLIAANIRSGTSVFGVPGSLTPAYSACTDDQINAGQCSTATNRYVTATAGANVNGANGQLSFTIPLGFQDGTKTATASDTNLLAANIKSGVSIFGTAGSLTEAYAACSDNALNAGQCSTVANRYVATAAGANVNGSNGQLSMTIPQGFYSGAQTATAADTNLVANNIRSGVTVFGTTGNLTPAYAACTDDQINAGQCSTATNRYVTSTLGNTVNGGAGQLSFAIPLGFYDGTKNAVASDADLIAGNIRTGINLFGVPGSLTPAYTACTDDQLNAGQCSTATNRYVTSTAGNNVNGADGQISFTIPLGFQDGTKTATAQDSDLIAGNIRSGTNVFGVPGSLTPAYSACTDNALNAGQCSTATNRYVTGTLGNNVNGTNGQISVTIPQGFYDGTKTTTAADTDLIASNIRSGTDIFGVPGSLTPAYTACTDDALNAGQCSTATNRYVTAAAGNNIFLWLNPLASDTIGNSILDGYYSGKSISFQDTDLVASNIRSGTDIFGVTGNLTAAHAACSDNAFNAGQCSTATNRYVATAAGSNVNGTAGQLSMTIPQGFYTGAQTATASDADIIAANIKSGVDIFGTVGNLVAAYAACSDNAFNAGQCSTATNRYVSPTLGTTVTVSGSTSATIPQGYYSGAHSCSVSDANLTAANIKNGVAILGVTGSYTGAGSSTYASNMYRDKTTSQITQIDESSAGGTAYTNADPGYRAVPKISKDDDGYTGGSVTYVNRAGWSTTTCGTSGTLAARISNCASQFGANATWDGATKANMGQGEWKLVSRTGNIASSMGKEVWQDQRTGMMWSSLVSTSLNWCKASGSNYISGNPVAENDPSGYCTNSSYQATSGQAVSACFEDNGTYFTTTDGGINNNGKAGLNRASSPSVAWRLPTRSDYMIAEANGIRFVLPDMGPAAPNYEWSASVVSYNRDYAWSFYGLDGYVSYDYRSNSYAVRCVGR